MKINLKGVLRVIKETKQGFATIIDWKCDYCGHLSSLNTSPKQNQSYEINTRIVTALKTMSCGGSYKVAETLGAHIDSPSLTCNAFFKRSKNIGKTIEGVVEISTLIFL